MMIETIVTATEAETNFAEMIRRVSEQQETIIIQPVGKPEVVLISRAQYTYAPHYQPWAQIWAKVDALWEPLDNSAGDWPPLVDVIQQMREERDAELAPHLS